MQVILADSIREASSLTSDNTLTGARKSKTGDACNGCLWASSLRVSREPLGVPRVLFARLVGSQDAELPQDEIQRNTRSKQHITRMPHCPGCP